MIKATAPSVVCTGPKTEAGKKVSSMNATKHGLTAKKWLNEAEEDQYQTLLAGLVEEYEPQTPTERLLVERIANIATRQQRFWSVENALFEEVREYNGSHRSVIHSFGSVCESALATFSTIERIKRFPINIDAALQRELESVTDVRDIYDYLYVINHLPETRKKLLADCRRWNMSIQGVISEELGRRHELGVSANYGSVGDDYTIQTDEELDRTGFYANTLLLQNYVQFQIAKSYQKSLIADAVKGYEKRRNLLVEMAMPSPDVMDRLMRYQTSLDRQFSKALGELLHVIDRRK